MPNPRVPASSEPRPDCPKCGKSLTGPWHMRYCEPEPHESERIAEFAARGSSEPRPENPYRTVHARMSPPGAAWDEGFAAGRAAATPRCGACDEPFDGQCAACRAEDDTRHPQDEFDGAGCCPEEDGFLRAKARAAATPTPSDEEGWSPGIDDPEPRALGDIDTGEGWYQT